VSIGSEEEEENDMPGVLPQTDPNVSKAAETKGRAKPVAIKSIEDVEDIPTDVEELVEDIAMPKKRGLKRSYAMLDVRFEDPADPEFEAPSEQEEATSAGIVELDDDDETPKKKKKAAKPPVREAIKANRGQPLAAGKKEVNVFVDFLLIILN